jgi:formate dehydrogenase iron-sulfur subunit
LHLREQGETRAYLYGADPNGPLGGLNSFYLLVDEPEVYGLPREPKMPTRNLVKGSLLSTFGALMLAAAGALTLRARRMREVVASSHAKE